MVIYGVRFRDCGCDEVHQHPDRASAQFWSTYGGADGELKLSTDDGATWHDAE